MYNRYIGNTGKVIRVEEETDRERHDKNAAPQRHIEPHRQEARREEKNSIHDDKTGNTEAPLRAEIKKPSFLSGLSGLGGGFLKSIDAALPFGLETGDLVLLALFLFLYIESGDEEFLIILGFLAYSFFKDSKDKEMN